MKKETDRQRIDIANVILDIVDREKRYVSLAGGNAPEDEEGTVAELRMQLREVAFALLVGKEVTPRMLH